MNHTLVNFRNRKNMSQVEFARIIGVSLSYYSKIELDDRNPSYGFLKKLKIAFNDINIDETFFSDK